MTMRSIIALALALVVIISLVSIWFYPSIQDFMRTNPFWNGIKDFSDEFDATWTESLLDSTQNPESTTLIIIPYSIYKQDDLQEINRFVREGGVLLLLDDYGYGNTLLEQFGLEARFSGNPMVDPLFCYKNEWLPRITDFHPEVTQAGIESVVLNHGTALLEVDSTQVLAMSSESSYLDLNGNTILDDGEPQGPFPVATVSILGDGTVLLLSDPSILINSMVGRDNNHNFLDYIIMQYGQDRELLMDISHLPKSPLDDSKSTLTQTRERIAHPYSVVVVMGIVVSLFLRPWQREEAS